MTSPLRPIEELDKASRKLVALAMKARKRAYAPYSNFLVGAVIVDNKGRVHSGCNVENAALVNTLHAEIVALGKMVSRRGGSVRLVVVVTSADEPVMPCGCCLQTLVEFGKKAIVVGVNKKGTAFRTSTIADLLPSAFSGAWLK